MALSDFVHSLFVLLTTLSYLLPAYEGFQRKSLFYTLLFLVLVCLSFLLHGEDLSLWAPLEPKLDARVHNISDSLAYFLLSCMLLVVFEIRNERLGRVVAGAWTILVWLTDPSALARNVAVCAPMMRVVESPRPAPRTDLAASCRGDARASSVVYH